MKSTAHCCDVKSDWNSSYRLCVFQLSKPLDSLIDLISQILPRTLIDVTHTVWCTACHDFNLVSACTPIIYIFMWSFVLLLRTWLGLTAMEALAQTFDLWHQQTVDRCLTQWRNIIPCVMSNQMNLRIYRLECVCMCRPWPIYSAWAHHLDDTLLLNDFDYCFITYPCSLPCHEHIVSTHTQKTGETFTKDVNNPIVCCLFPRKATD